LAILGPLDFLYYAKRGPGKQIIVSYKTQK